MKSLSSLLRSLVCIRVLPAVGLLGIVQCVQADPYTRFSADPTAGNALDYMHQVATHPRCANCHGKLVGGAHRPTVGDEQRPHPMNISSANNLRLMADDHGFREAPGSAQAVNCRGCHQDDNGLAIGSPPGAANTLMPGFVWHMPPQTMIIADDLSAARLCEQWLDPARNSFLAVRGSREDLKTFEKEFMHHVRDDPLIRWSWEPGAGRSPAPGSHADFVRAMQIWIDAGVPCF